MSVPRINPALMSAAARESLERILQGNPTSFEAPSLSTSPEPAKKKSKKKSSQAPKEVDPTLRLPIGGKYGKLTVLAHGKAVQKKRMSLCKCDCGSYTIVANEKLVHHEVTDCGCGFALETYRALKEQRAKRSPLYILWEEIKYRCLCPDSQFYHMYGAKGIKVCDTWLNSFKTFKEWALANGWEQGKVLKRKNLQEDFSPRNCIWKTAPGIDSEISDDYLVKYKGKVRTIGEWSMLTGFHINTLKSRIKKGWTEEEIIGLPLNVREDRENKQPQKYIRFPLYINPMILSTGQQKKINFVTKTIFSDSRVENGMRLIEIAAKEYTERVCRVCPHGTRVAITVTFLTPHSSSSSPFTKVERGLMGEKFDCDNKFKSVCDALTKAGWWPDDVVVTTVKLEKRRTNGIPRIEFLIEPDTIREPSLLSCEELLLDDTITPSFLYEPTEKIAQTTNVQAPSDTPPYQQTEFTL